MKLSASGLERAQACPASTVLPRINSTSDAAAKGTAIHAYLEAIQNGVDSVTALNSVEPQYRSACEGIDLAALPIGPGAVAEIGVSYDPGTGAVRILGTGLGHGDATAPEGHITGIADLARDLPSDDSVYVCDYKTGYGFVRSAAHNPQLRFLALCLAKAWGRSRARVAIVKPREDGSVYIDTADLDAFALAEVEQEVKAIVQSSIQEAGKRAAGSPLSYTRGEHCTYCPSFDYCDAQTLAIVRLASGSGQEIEQQVTTALDSGKAADAYQAFKNAEVTMKRVKSSLYRWAAKNPIPLPDGRVYGEIVYPKEVILGDLAVEAVRRICGEDVRLETKVTKKAIQGAAKQLSEKRKGLGVKTTIKAAGEELLAAVSANGGMVQEMRRKVCEHKPGEKVEEWDD